METMDPNPYGEVEGHKELKVWKVWFSTKS